MNDLNNNGYDDNENITPEDSGQSRPHSNSYDNREEQSNRDYQQPPVYNYDTDEYNQKSQNRNQQDFYRWDYNGYEAYNQEPKKRKNKGMVVFLIVVVAFLVIGVAAVSVVGIVGYRDVDTAQTEVTDEGAQSQLPEDGQGEKVQLPTATQVPGKDDTLPAAGELLTVPQVAKKVTPSVVGILRYENTLYEATGLGSGFILHVDDEGYGYVVTNAHVVEYGTNFKIRLFDGVEYNAELVGADATSDIAVLKVKTENKDELIPATIGDSEQLEVGETVVAIGNPISFELSGSVTQGIVSALDRQLQIGSSINYIQTDAAINPGNSGGALVNLYGQVIGINTMKVQATGYEGIGFAIPMAEALPIINELVEHGRVTSRPILGITGREITEIESMRLECPMGIMVYSVSEQAQFDPEIKVEDVITHVNGERIMTLADLKEELNKFKVGDEVQIRVFRMVDTVRSEEVDINVTLIASEE